MKRLLAALMLALSLPAGADATYISIILDDIGHNRARGERAIALPAPVTLAILPYARHSAALARRASEEGREVMVHMPMANLSGQSIGPHGLMPEMTHPEFVRSFEDALAQLPTARGMNNHMGSLLTARPIEMRWLMQEIKRREMFFIDSRTTADTVASTIADQYAVASASRDVFLDNEQTPESIHAAFDHLIATAKANGTAIAIGHPYPATLEYLETALPALAQQGVQVIPVSHAIALRRILAASQAREAATD